MSLCSDIFDGKEKISVIGLGYIGIPLAVSFAKKAKVIGFDINKEKIALYKSGIDPTGEVGNGEIKNTSVYFTSNPEELKNAKAITKHYPHILELLETERAMEAQVKTQYRERTR